MPISLTFYVNQVIIDSDPLDTARRLIFIVSSMLSHRSNAVDNVRTIQFKISDNLMRFSAEKLRSKNKWSFSALRRWGTHENTPRRGHHKPLLTIKPIRNAEHLLEIAHFNCARNEPNSSERGLYWSSATNTRLCRRSKGETEKAHRTQWRIVNSRPPFYRE